MAVCRYHPDRPGVGVCMRCRVVICSACCTRLDGVNHCHACLKALGRSEQPVRPGVPAAWWAVCVLTGAVGLLFLGAWLVQGVLAP